MKARSSIVVLAGLSLVCAASVTAQTNVTIQNAAFATFNTLNNTTANGSWNSGPIPSWTTSPAGCAGSYQPNTTAYPGGSPSPMSAWVNCGNISQTLTASLQANSTYTFSASVGHIATFDATFTVTLSVGTTTLCTSSASNTAIPNGTWATESCTYASGATPPSGNLTVTLASSTTQNDFTNVSLSYVSASHQAVLTWTDNNNPSGTQYNIYRSGGPSCTSFIRLNGNPVGALTYTDATIVSGQSYCFEVRAINGSGESIAGDNLFLVVQ